MRNFVLVAVVLLVVSSFTYAGASLDLDYGYSKLKLEGRDNNLDDASGMGGDLVIGIGPLPHVVDSLRINLGAGFRFYDENGNGKDDNHPDKSQLLMLTAQ